MSEKYQSPPNQDVNWIQFQSESSDEYSWTGRNEKLISKSNYMRIAMKTLGKKMREW